MATAFAEPQGEGGNTPPPNNDAEIQTGASDAVDFEAEARKMGWVGKDEFKGDPDKHIDAETFYTRSQDLMPILRAANKQLREKIDRIERDNKKAAEFFSQAEQRAYERARADIRAEIAAASDADDPKALAAAVDKLENLQKPNAQAPADDSQRADEFADWMTANKWYANEAFRPYADAEAEKLAKTKNGFLDRADLDAISEKVKAKFGAAFPEEFGVGRPRTARNAVDPGGSAPPRRSGRTFADLPPEAARMCDRWVANGTIKSREDYVKSYQWDK